MSLQPKQVLFIFLQGTSALQGYGYGNGFSCKNIFTTNSGTMALLHRVSGAWVSLNLGVGLCPRADRETTVCVERELIKRTRVCLTDTKGSLSSNNNSLMKVCVCKGIRAAVVMNHETHQSCVIDQIPNTRLTEINTAAM